MQTSCLPRITDRLSSSEDAGKRAGSSTLIPVSPPAMPPLAKLILLAFGLAPFIALFKNVRQPDSWAFVFTAAISTLAGAAFYDSYCMGRHPRIAGVFLVLSISWPVALIIAKVLTPSIPWKRLWITVPLMSWFTIVTAVSTNYPVNGGGGGFGMLFNLVVGWVYMIPVFGVFQLACMLILRTRKSCRAT